MKKIITTISLFVAYLYAQTDSLTVNKTIEQVTNTESSIKISDLLNEVNIVLIIVALLLTIPIHYLTKSLLYATKTFINSKKNSNTKTISSVILFMLLGNTIYGQNEIVEKANPFLTSNSLTLFLTFLILIEIIAIVGLIIQVNKFLNYEEENSTVTVQKENSFISWWNKVNNFKKPHEEETIDTGHNYDGIRELDNITPPWFTTAFVICIIFAGIYLMRYHVLKTSPLQEEEFNLSMIEAEKQKQEYLAKQSNNIDENNVKLLSDNDKENGKAIFIKNCAVCHGENGASMVGGVGPNLTDDYWIYGNSLKDVFMTIKYGRPNGMKAWEQELSPLDISQLTTYIYSISGTNLPGKEKQGILVVNNKIDSTIVDSIIVDSIKK